ncbi:hypothetical protein L7F22_061378 [Adiantum nelumboides]|nr:hypothetical protein [Adiantum nelumboides]
MDNEKAFLKTKGQKFKYSDLIYSEMELPLRLVFQHLRVQKPPRYTEPIQHIVVVMALVMAEDRIIRCNYEGYILENLMEANLKGSAKNKLYMIAWPTLTRIAYQALSMIEDLLAASSQASLIQNAKLIARSVRTTTTAISLRATRSSKLESSSDDEKTNTYKEESPQQEVHSEFEDSDEEDNSTPLERKAIALSIKCTITPHIRSAKSAKQAWDILASHYAGRNEAKIALLRKELESKIMNKEDDMDTFLDDVKDVNEQLIFASEDILDSFLVQIVLDALPYSYQTFASTWRIMNQGNPEVVNFDEAFIAVQRRGENSNAATSHGSSASGKSPVLNASTGINSSGNSGNKGKKKMRCHYYKSNDHLIKQCPKLKAKETKKKEDGSTINAAIVEASMKEVCDAHVDAKWAFSAKCTYNPAVHDACMSIAADSHVWYFDSGAV